MIIRLGKLGHFPGTTSLRQCVSLGSLKSVSELVSSGLRVNGLLRVRAELLYSSVYETYNNVQKERIFLNRDN